MTIEEAIHKSAHALKIGIHENWVALALISDGIPQQRIPTIILWAKQFILKGTKIIPPVDEKVS